MGWGEEGGEERQRVEERLKINRGQGRDRTWWGRDGGTVILARYPSIDGGRVRRSLVLWEYNKERRAERGTISG